MPIDLPADVIARIHEFTAAGYGRDAGEVVRKALDTMKASDPEVQAVLEGVEAYERGEYVSLKDFDREFRAKHGIAPDA